MDLPSASTAVRSTKPPTTFKSWCPVQHRQRQRSWSGIVAPTGLTLNVTTLKVFSHNPALLLAGFKAKRCAHMRCLGPRLHGQDPCSPLSAYFPKNVAKHEGFLPSLKSRLWDLRIKWEDVLVQAYGLKWCHFTQSCATMKDCMANAKSFVN